MEQILENWWQFTIIVLVLMAAIYITGKSTEGTLKEINILLKTLSKEIFLTTASRRAAIVNIILGLLAGVITLALAVPNILAQLGLKEENNSSQAVIVFTLFILTIIISLNNIGKFETQYIAFKDDDVKLEKNQDQVEKAGVDNSVKMEKLKNKKVKK